MEKLFDTLISPILLYCNEIWGVDVNNSDSSIVEKFHMKFIKEILGVHCKAMNVACRSELGRLPLQSKIMFSCIKFLNHSENTLAFKIFKATENNNPWTKKVYSIIHKLGFSYIIYGKCSFTSLLACIKQRIKDIFIQDQSSHILNSNKLIFYQNIYKNNYIRSKYVDILYRKTDRSTLCKIRLSAHNLEIEKGRQLSIPTNERLCKICNSGNIEDEQHFLFSCHKYSFVRDQYKIKLSNILNRDITTFNNNFLKECLNSNSNTVLKITCCFIEDCLSIRNNILS